MKRGLSVSEHGITDTETDEVTLCETEHEVYERLGYAYIEPELREGRGELKAAREGKLPELVELGDIRGDLHAHTTLSDGRNSLAEMAEAGRDRGYAYMAITDHSASHGFGDDVQPRRPAQADRGGRAPGTPSTAAAASASWSARRSTSASTARSTIPTTWSPNWTGSSPPSTPPSTSPKRT